MKLNFKSKESYWLFCCGLILSFNLFSQTAQFVNEEWNMTNGNVGQDDHVATALDPSGNLVYLTNDNSTGNEDIFLNCIHPNGNVIWQQTCPSSPNQDDFGIDLKIDNQGNIYLAAARSNGSNLDYYVAKYTQSGSFVWEYVYDGTGGDADVPAALLLTASNDVIVTGTSMGQGTLTDFTTIKLNGGSGNLDWIKRYSVNKPQVAAAMTLDGQGNLFVSGSTFINFSNAHILTVKYNVSSGAQLGVKINTSAGSGYDIVSGVTTNNGQVFVLTSTKTNTNSGNIKLIAYNSNLQELWESEYDREGLKDEGYGLAISNSGNPIITGYGTKASGGTDMIVAEYSATNGSVLWMIEKTALLDSETSKGRAITVDANGTIYIAGSEDHNGSLNFMTIALTPLGEHKWTRHFDNDSNGLDEARTILQNNESIFVTGRSVVQSTEVIASVKYSTRERNLTAVTDSYNIEYVQNSLIVRFDRSKLKLSVIDEQGFEAGVVDDFVDYDFIQEMNQVAGFDMGKLPTYKIHRRATTEDSLSITRLGDTIKVPDFWAKLIIELPSEVDEQVLGDSLATLFGIQYAQRELIYRTYEVPNDVFYNGYQLGLYPNNIYPNSDIDIEGAWDYESGKDYVKVGVYDNVIDWSHIEFGQSGIFSNSKVTGGWNYLASTDVSLGNLVEGNHGTRVAGIIGANRGEGAGIAGIAGGNMQFNPYNNGVQLFSMGVLSGNNSSTSAILAEAIEEGGLQTISGYGYGLHVTNHSYGTTSFPDPAVRDAIELVWRNHSVFVASRGNSGNSGNPASWPACFDDNKVLNVMASGTNGERKVGTSNGEDTWASSYGLSGANNTPVCM